MKKATFSFEKKLAEKGFDFVIGVDEAGRGPLCGPVVAAAVSLRNFQFSIFNFQLNSNDQIFNDSMWKLVRDSKKLSEKQREKVFDFIQENFHVGIGLCDHKTIDRINILEASFLAMKKAVASLKREMTNDKFPMTNQIQNLNDKNQDTKYEIRDTRYVILVDGNKKIPNFSMEQMAIVGGDEIVKSISAASIVAKVTRDRIMLEMHKKYPQYGFNKHKGYGTKMHMEALKKHGASEIHRQSFAPVKKTFKSLSLTFSAKNAKFS
jgi:ribonuclease HII